MQSLTKYQEQFPIILKFVWKYERTQIVKTILRKNRINNSHPLTLEYTAKKQLSKGLRYWHKNRHMYQWNRIKIPKINPYIYDQLMYYKEGKNIKWRKDSLFNKWCWENWTTICKRMKLYYLSAYTKKQNKTKKTQNGLKT